MKTVQEIMAENGEWYGREEICSGIAERGCDRQRH